MTADRGKHIERAARLAAFVLVMGAATAACASSDRPAPSGGSGSAVPPVGVRDAAPTDGADADGAEASANDCNALPNHAPPYPITFTTTAAPPAFAAGVIADGTYFETREVHYGEASELPPITSPGITLTIAGSALKYGAYTADGAYVPMAAQLRIEQADAGDPDAGDDAGTGDMLVIAKTCPIAGGSLGPQPYSVEGNDFTIGFGTYTITYSRQ